MQGRVENSLMDGKMICQLVNIVHAKRNQVLYKVGKVQSTVPSISCDFIIFTIQFSPKNKHSVVQADPGTAKALCRQRSIRTATMQAVVGAPKHCGSLCKHNTANT